MIEHLLCTHCTFGTSALEDASGDAAARVLGYSVRASSIPENDKGRLREEFRAVERLLSYDLPGDATAEHKTRLDARTAPVRLCFLPDLAGRQVVGQVAFRQFDTANRPGSYFAHLLVGTAARPWCPLECLRLWAAGDPSGRRGWADADRADGFAGLRPLDSIGGWLEADRGWLGDAVVRTFLRTGSAVAGGSPVTAIPARWAKDTTEADRTDLVARILQALLEKNSLPAVILAVEPTVAAILFYAALRLLPESLRGGIGFSTYETDPTRAAVRLVATTFINATGDLKPQANQGGAFVVNTFRQPWLGTGGLRPGRYATWAAQRLLKGELDRVKDLSQSVAKTWDSAQPSVAEVERIIDLEDCRIRLFQGKSVSMPVDLTAGLQRFLAIRCSEKIRRSIGDLARMPPGDAATLIRRLERIYRPVPREWDRLKQEPTVAGWLRNSRPLDEKSVGAKLVQPASIVPDDEAVELIVSCDCVTNDRRLPEVCPQTKRLWGEFPAADSTADYTPPAFFMKVLGQLEPGTLARLLPRPLPPLRIIMGLARAIATPLEATPPGATATRIQSHLRRLLDDAAGGTEPGLEPEDFEKILGEMKMCAQHYDPVPGDFGRRISAFVKGLRHRPADVCVDARLVNLAAVWAGCAADHEVLHGQVLAWKKLLGWFAIFDQSGKIPFKDELVFENVTETKARLAEIKSVVCDLVPGSGSAIDNDRKTLVHEIFNTYTKRGWLKNPSQKGVLARVLGRGQPPLGGIIEEMFKQSLR